MADNTYSISEIVGTSTEQRRRRRPRRRRARLEDPAPPRLVRGHRHPRAHREQRAVPFPGHAEGRIPARRAARLTRPGRRDAAIRAEPVHPVAGPAAAGAFRAGPRTPGSAPWSCGGRATTAPGAFHARADRLAGDLRTGPAEFRRRGHGGRGARTGRRPGVAPGGCAGASRPRCGIAQDCGCQRLNLLLGLRQPGYPLDRPGGTCARDNVAWAAKPAASTSAAQIHDRGTELGG